MLQALQVEREFVAQALRPARLQVAEFRPGAPACEAALRRALEHPAAKLGQLAGQGVVGAHRRRSHSRAPRSTDVHARCWRTAARTKITTRNASRARRTITTWPRRPAPSPPARVRWTPRPSECSWP